MTDLMTMTTEQIETALVSLTSAFHGDKRPTRDDDGEVLPEVETILAERNACKLERRALRLELARRNLGAEAMTPPRARDVITLELAKVNAERRKLTDYAHRLARELERCGLVEELAAMPDAKREALRTILDVKGVPNVSAVHTPGASKR